MLSEYVETAKITEKISKEKTSDLEKINKLKEELKDNWLDHMAEVIEKVMLENNKETKFKFNH